MTTPSSEWTAVRGRLVYFVDDPFAVGIESARVHEPDGVVLVRDGRIEAVGPAHAVALPPGVVPARYENAIVTAGFVDGHVHYAQTEIVGAFGKKLVDWLETYAFPIEEAFADRAHADAIAEVFADELLRNGTTTAMVFGTVFPDSIDALFAAAEKRGLHVLSGKVLMDRNAPIALCDTPKRAYDESKTLIARWHGRGRGRYAITPRFAATSSEEELEIAGALFREHPGVHVHSHVAENLEEVAWVRSLFPGRASYLDVYDHFGLLGPRASYAHGVHLSEAELTRCHETGTSLAHCPSSNLFLGSGLFSIERAKDPSRPVALSLGTDVGAGTSFSLLRTLGDAYKVAQLRDYALHAAHGFYLATLGGARALRVDDRVGTLRKGLDADLVVLDLGATPLLRTRMARVDDVDEALFVLMTLGDDRAVRATYLEGLLAYVRDDP